MPYFPPASSASAITVREADGAPSVNPVTEIKVSNGTLTDNTGGSVTIDTTGAGVADILDLTTAEADDTLVLAPDGAGGVEFRAETGGGGLTQPDVIQMVLSSNGASHTIAAAASGHRLIMLTNSTTGQITSPVCTNVTWTQLKTQASAGSFYAIWVGVVAGGASGTSLTMTLPGSFCSIALLEVTDALTPTLGQSASVAAINQNAGVSNTMRMSGHTAGRLVAFACGSDNTTLEQRIHPSLPAAGVFEAQACCLAVAYATSSAVTCGAFNNSGSAGAGMIAEIF